MRNIISCLASAAVIALCNVTAPVLAQGTPSTVRFVYPNAAGSSGDALTRLIADQLRSRFGQTAIVENKPGAGGRLGLFAVKTAQPDGATLLLTQMAPMTLSPHVQKTVKSPQELLQWLKTNPDKATFGGPGSGGLPHFFGLLVGQAAGVEMTHVPYKGTANIITDLLGGQVPMMVSLASDLAPLHKDGKLRVIATSDSERFAELPDVPTFKESGIDIVGRGWFAVYGPAHMPPATVERLNKSIVAILQSPEVRARITALGLKPMGSSPEELAAIQTADAAKWGPIIKASGVTLD
jgi:tripartite-type tricarboxylate transporter receptor subunit TctC